MRCLVGSIWLVLTFLLISALGEQKECTARFEKVYVKGQAYCYRFLRYGFHEAKIIGDELDLADKRCKAAGPKEPHARLISVESEEERQRVDDLFLDVQQDAAMAVRKTSAFLVGMRASVGGAHMRTHFASLDGTDPTFVLNTLHASPAINARCVFYSHSRGFFMDVCRGTNLGMLRRFVACKYAPRQKKYRARVKRKDFVKGRVLSNVIGELQRHFGSEERARLLWASNLTTEDISNLDVWGEHETPGNWDKDQIVATDPTDEPGEYKDYEEGEVTQQLKIADPGSSSQPDQLVSVSNSLGGDMLQGGGNGTQTTTAGGKGASTVRLSALAVLGPFAIVSAIDATWA